jgi:hypothetical protein
VHLSDFYNVPRRRVELDDLDRTVAWIENVGARPLICFDKAPDWLEGSGTGSWLEQNDEFVRLCVKVAQRSAATKSQRYYEVFDEPLTTGLFADVKELTQVYNELAVAIAEADPKGRVGGPGLDAAWRDHLQYFLKHAQLLHFLSFHFYGTHNSVTSGAELVRAARETRASDLPNQLTFAEVRELARSSRRTPPEVFVTECAANSLRTEDGRARDPRLTQVFGAAWIATLQVAAASQVDKVCYYQLVGKGWGLLDDEARPNKVYPAVSLLAKHLPRGSTLCDLQAPGEGALAAAVSTPTARNIVLVHAAEGDATLSVQPTGLGTPATVRLVQFDSHGSGVTTKTLAPADQYDIQFRGPGVAVIEFPGEE